jgi:phosphoenolpyruvate synthase/pyruvate phosphate dikinase
MLGGKTGGVQLAEAGKDYKDLLEGRTTFPKQKAKLKSKRAGNKKGGSAMAKKYVYFFGKGRAEGNAKMKNLLGGKGANLAEMSRIGLPVPPGFTITTEMCKVYYEHKKRYPQELREQVNQNLKKLEEATGKKFGDKNNPLLVSVRSGAAVSMPGMMDTILNLGLNDEAVQGLIRLTKNPRFAWDSYRRFIQMFGNVAMGVPHHAFEHELEEIKRGLAKKVGIKDADTLVQEALNKRVPDTALGVDDLKELVSRFKKIYKKYTKQDFPQDPQRQLWHAIDAVFGSWNNQRAIAYREIHNIKGLLGTAVNVQTMVFGNMGQDSGTGVGFTRNPSTGDDALYGEFLMNAQGEDVVAGIRTPHPISELKKQNKKIYEELLKIRTKLERHYRDMQDFEFTIERGKLFMLQTRVGKRTAQAAVKIAVDMARQKLIDKKTAISRIQPEQIDQLLHPMFDTEEEKKARIFSQAGLPASPGAAVGQVVFTAKEAEEWKKEGKNVILCRVETSPEDIRGINAAQGILTARGGMTCIAQDSLILLSEGFFSVQKVFEKFEKGEKLFILSYDTRKSKFVWREIIACGRKKSPVVKIIPSQTGRSQYDYLRLTPDHKFFTCRGPELVKKPIREIIEQEEYIAIPERIPGWGQRREEKLAYLAGAIFTDGYVKLKKYKGNVTFTQKEDEDKKEFIDTIKSYFDEVFGSKMIERIKISSAYLRGRRITGVAKDLISQKKYPALILNTLKKEIAKWLLSLDEISLLNFLAGTIDGDGTFVSNRIQLFVSQQYLLEGIIIACLRLGIVPQVTVNRNIYNIIIRERIEDILKFCKRIKGDIRERFYGTKLFPMRQIFVDIADKVNFRSRVKEAVKRNLLFDGKKIERDILPLCLHLNPVGEKLKVLLASPLRFYRVNKISKRREITFVYNFEVKADNELDKNFVVFTKMFTPLLVSNSHAAVVARGMGKCCVAGAGDITIDEHKREMRAGDVVVKEGDWISLNGSRGVVYLDKIKTIPPKMTGPFGILMKWADEFRRLGVRTNADTPHDAKVALEFGAEGIGLCRTEHMFFEGERIISFRKMILVAPQVKRLRDAIAQERDEKKKKELEEQLKKPIQQYLGALGELLPLQKGDFEEIFRILGGYPCTIRLLDPPLHEFLPHEERGQRELAEALGITPQEVKDTVEALGELNPMLGHRGCRLGITFPEITQMQAQAIIEAALNVHSQGIKVKPEIMVPLVGHPKELELQKEVILQTIEKIKKERGLKRLPFEVKIGTMIEVPRACLTADEVAKSAEFFSFGTNDLTQMGCGFSRDDAGKFLIDYVNLGIYQDDPFQSLDIEGIGKLVKIATELGRKVRRDLKIGICGEHGGDPKSVKFCHSVGLDYVSCSPFRVPIARLAAAQAVIEEKGKSSKKK